MAVELNSKVGESDFEYGRTIKKIGDIFELFGIDKNIINEKLDNGDVSQTEFDYALEELKGNNR